VFGALGPSRLLACLIPLRSERHAGTRHGNLMHQQCAPAFLGQACSGPLAPPAYSLVLSHFVRSATQELGMATSGFQASCASLPRSSVFGEFRVPGAGRVDEASRTSMQELAKCRGRPADRPRRFCPSRRGQSPIEHVSIVGRIRLSSRTWATPW